MIAVEPIRDKKKLNDMKIYLKGKRLRDYTLFVVGINVALRISDLLALTWADILSDNKRSFKSINLREGKTKKKRNIELNKASQKALSELLETLDCYELDDYVFDQSSDEKENGMGPDIVYSFDSEDNYECAECGNLVRISGWIREYPIGAYDSESININKWED